MGTPPIGGSVVFVASSGGVLLDALAMRRLQPDQPARWMAVRTPQSVDLLADEAVEWIPERSVRDPRGLAVAFVHARRRLRELRPERVVSAGSGCAVPWFVAARTVGIPSLWIETQNLHGERGLASRLCGRMADAAVVQTPDQLVSRRRGLLLGELY